MSNRLSIEVHPSRDEDRVLVLAADNYAMWWNSYLKEDFKKAFPTQEELVVEILKDNAYEDGVIFQEDGSYILDGINFIEVFGYDEMMKT